ncbi:SDR family oxidoreductase [Microbacterium sp. NE2HP2]|jgi:gluconate 5-dehydrogenase|uniref:SDR family oxidoreductase n=1 Tax=Microbacterium plantarum TaxID=1816425 RepID=A0ABV5ETS9_9MICO|nr:MULTISPECIES: glucose 1-dehydrogenase [Microbacterium]MDF2919329.1 gluconate 5-dehydrogenase [Microbacterium sp.]MDD7943945.1 SDR family oxidoreductase [Microbacterium plantarum]RAZ30255.1 gluconate 5-dehydrogenase [Microbacterium sp. SMR1]WHE34908.1 SDR family oxidoreductase [Microbacterium sp. BDGP8]WRK16011.1 SDR family oxidoreductase [Microbacterium plantarum]
MSSLFDVTGRVALVTGSSRGLGRSLALALAREGARVVVHGRDAEAVERTRREAAEAGSPEPVAAVFDVTDAAAVEAGVAAIVAEVGVPDILVNNAGIQRRAPFAEFSVSDWDEIVAANLNGVFYVARFVAPGMVERGSGKIVNIASVQSALARQTIAPYSATKGAVAQLTKGMAADLARHNVQVNALSPGYFATEMNRALVDDADFSAWLTQRTPAQRWGDFSELDGALLFLCSDASSFVSGQNIFVDGGMTAVV